MRLSRSEQRARSSSCTEVVTLKAGGKERGRGESAAGAVMARLGGEGKEEAGHPGGTLVEASEEEKEKSGVL